MPFRYRHVRCAAALILTVTALAGCSRERHYEVRGRVVGFSDDPHTILIEHEEIPGFMPAMTMPFQVADTASVRSFEVGSAVAFELVVDARRSLIRNISELPDDALPEHPAGRRDAYAPDSTDILESGDEMPDAELLTHADTTLRLSALRGRRILLTFIYTSCPLPDYCPLMSKHFAQLQREIDDIGGPPVRLLTISFDPATDTPEVLRSYAARYTDDLSDWTFATGDSTDIGHLAKRFGVFYQPGTDEIIHNLVTALIDERGIVREIWRGNDWNPQGVMRALDQANDAGEAR